MDVATFRATYPAFASTGTYPDPLITQAIATADSFLDSAAWGGLGSPQYLYVEGLLTAHFTVLATAPGTTVMWTGSVGAGVMTSKKVGEVQANYATTTKLAMLQADNPFYLTIFGRQYMYLLNTSGPAAVAV